jgi:O-antigen/teichoic acid export membrane protein
MGSFSPRSCASGGAFQSTKITVSTSRSPWGLPINPSRQGGRILLRGGFISGAGYILRILARLVVALFAARLFGPKVFGAFVVAIAVVEAAAVASGLSTKWMLFKWLDANDREELRPAAHVLIDAALLVGVASLSISLAILGGVEWSGAVAPTTRLAILTLLPVIGLQSLMDLLLAATRWSHVMRYEFAAKSVIQPAASIVLALGAFLGGGGAQSLAIAYVAATALALGYAVHGARRSLGGFDFASYRPHELRAKLGAAMPTTASDLVDALYTRADIYLVAILLGERAAGIYAVARQISLPVRQTRQIFDAMLIPLVSKTLSLAGPRRALAAAGQSSRLVLIAQAPVGIAVAAAAPALLDFAHAHFPFAVFAVYLLAAAETLQGTFGISELIIVYAWPRRLAALTAGSLAVGMLSALFLAGQFAIAGVAGAVLVSYAIRAAGREAILVTELRRKIRPGFWAGPAVSIAAAILVVGGVYLLGRHMREQRLAEIAATTSLIVYAAAAGTWALSTRARLLPRGFVLQRRGD